jgi:hypothetical protein
MKEANMFKVGDKVTWGQGSCVAAVKELYKEYDPNGGEPNTFAIVALTRPVESTCGKVFQVGTPASFPVRELRHIN